MSRGANRSLLPDAHDPTRGHAQRWIDAAFSMLIEDTIGALRTGLEVTALSKRAGLRRDRFYECFPNGIDEAFVLDVLTHQTDSTTVSIDQVVEGVKAAQLDPGSAMSSRLLVRAIASENWRLGRAAPSFSLQLLTAIAATGSAEAARRSAAEYDRSTTAFVASYSSLLPVLQRSIRQPFTLHRLAVVLTALIEGLELRALVDDESVDDDLFADAVEGLLEGVLEPIGGEGTLPKLTSGLRPAEPAIRSRVIATVIELLSHQHPARQLSETEVAKRAGITTATLASLGGIGSVVLDAWAEFVPGFVEQLEHERLAGVGAVERLRNHLGRVARQGLANYELTNLLVQIMHSAAMSGDLAETRQRVPLPGLVADLLHEAHLVGELRLDPVGAAVDEPSEQRAREVARFITNSLFVVVLTNPCGPGEVDRHARELADFFWNQAVAWRVHPAGRRSADARHVQPGALVDGDAPRADPAAPTSSRRPPTPTR